MFVQVSLPEGLLLRDFPDALEDLAVVSHRHNNNTKCDYVHG